MIEVGTVDFKLQVTSIAANKKCLTIVQERTLWVSVADEEY